MTDSDLIVYIENLCIRSGKLNAYFLNTEAKWDPAAWAALQQVPGDTNRDRYLYLKNGGYRKCEQCDADITSWSKTPSRPTRFCSPECHNSHQGRNKPAGDMNCEICGSSYTPGPGRGVTCSVKCANEKRARTTMGKYGVRHVNQAPEIISKRLQTNLDKYGSPSPIGCPEVLDKTRITWQRNWGAQHPMQNPEFRDKFVQGIRADNQGEYIPTIRAREAFSAKHGVPSPFHLQDVVDRSKATRVEKYGVEWPFQSSEIRQKAVDNRVANLPATQRAARESVLWWQENYTLDISVTGLGEKFNIPQPTLSNYSSRLGIDIHPVAFSGIEREFGDRVADFARVERNRRDIIHPSELDIYLPDDKIAIEVNGLYWHQEAMVGRHYHRMKYDRCDEKGIRLFQFWDSELRSRMDVCISMIRNAVGLSSAIDARKCQVVELTDRKQIIGFVNTNHLAPLKSPGPFIKTLGLMYQGRVVSMMIFSLSRFKGKAAVELLRYCTEIGTRVRGGFTRLLHHCGYDSVVSYSDNRYSTGKVYQSAGFECTADTGSSLWWTDGQEIYHRMKSWDVARQDGETQADAMKRNRLFPIYDAGQRTWLWTRT